MSEQDKRLHRKGEDPRYHDFHEGVKEDSPFWGRVIIIVTVFALLVTFGVVDSLAESAAKVTPFWIKTATLTPEPTPEPTPVDFADWGNEWWDHCGFLSEYDGQQTYDYIIACYPEHVDNLTCATYFEMVEPGQFGGGELLILNIHRECDR